MHEIEFPHNNKRLYMPEHLGECNQEQYAHMAFLFYQYQVKDISFEQMRYNAVYQLLNMQPSESKLNQLDQDKRDTNIYQLSLLIDSFFDFQEEKKMQLKQDFRQNPMPKIPIVKGYLKGPKDNFEAMPFGQYLDALDIFGNFVEDPSPDLIFQLAATLYQKHTYQPTKVKQTAKALQKTYFGYVYGAYLLFTTFQQTINNSLIMIEGNLCDLSILFKKPKNFKKYTPYPSIGMKSTAFALAESGVFGTYNDVRNADMWDILARMYDLKLRDLEDEKRQEEQERKNKRK